MGPHRSEFPDGWESESLVGQVLAVYELRVRILEDLVLSAQLYNSGVNRLDR